MKCTERDLNADPFETGNIKNLEILNFEGRILNGEKKDGCQKLFGQDRL